MIKCELCNKEALYHSAKWISDESMVVYYWCSDHTPINTDKIDEDDLDMDEWEEQNSNRVTGL